MSEFKYVTDLNDFIASNMKKAKNTVEKKAMRDFLALEIYKDPTLNFLMCAKSSFTADEEIICEKVNKMFERDENIVKRATQSFTIDPASMKGVEDQFGGSDLEPIATPEQAEAIQQLFANDPNLGGNPAPYSFKYGEGLADGFDPQAPWIQTYSGRRFTPTNPNPNAIVIQDIAHALSMQCRFSGHCRYFYSVAQHCVLVSHICGKENALWGLLHDASEAYLVDVPRPLKRSGQFQAYLDFENQMQRAICQRFGLPEREPPAVKYADTVLLSTEARDLMSPLHPDWKQPVKPLPFKIEPWEPSKAESMYMERFVELIDIK